MKAKNDAFFYVYFYQKNAYLKNYKSNRKRKQEWQKHIMK